MRVITKENWNDITPDFIAGEVFLIDKPQRWSSFKVIHEVRKYCGTRKVGHAGTLDPRATGLLIICTGKKTKSITEFQDLGKTYTGVITIGKRTPSMDAETEASEEKDFSYVTHSMIEDVRKSFLGETEQIPPMYSAVNFGGKKLYKIARAGKEVKREPRKITVSEFEIENIDLPDIRFRISCSKGTYIRVIADDFGMKLGCGAFLSELRRTGIGVYEVDKAFSPQEFIGLMRLKGAVELSS